MRRRVYFYLVILVVTLGIAVVWFSRTPLSFVSSPNVVRFVWPFGEKERPWMTVFVHGSFCSPAGFLDFCAVTRDDIEGSVYSKVVHKMREEQFFQQGQPILGRGLTRVRTTNLVDLDRSKRQAAFPILSAYKEMLCLKFPEATGERFYLFGWTGLMSQSRRRKESVRLYNALVEEIGRLRKKGINPRLRILAHSHGANVVLNMAGLKEALEDDWKSLPSLEEESCLRSVCEHFGRLIVDLPSRTVALEEEGQKRWDYVPEGSLEVDELFMFGAPLQPETAYFARSPFFKTVVSVYSDEDGVQGRDWVSTSHITSEKRFDRLPLKSVRGLGETNKLVQVRVTAGLSERRSGPSESTGVSWLKTVFGLDDVVRRTMDPTHRELWFLVPPSEGEPPFLKPVPTVVLVPMIEKLLATVTDFLDLDVDFSFKDDFLVASLLDHAKGKVLCEDKLSKVTFEFIREQLGDWMPSGEEDERQARDIMEECIHICSSLS